MYRRRADPGAPMIRTPLCDRFGVEHPILNAPMGGGDAPGRLAAAVSEAGALGMIGGTTYEGERIIALSFGDPTPFVARAQAAGAVVICQVRTVEEARRAVGAGVDVIT